MIFLPSKMKNRPWLVIPIIFVDLSFGNAASPEIIANHPHLPQYLASSKYVCESEQVERMDHLVSQEFLMDSEAPADYFS